MNCQKDEFNMLQPLLSIITPSYNRASHLTTCWKSLKSQTNFSFEWIIVDDGSTDNTKEVVSDIVCAESDFKIYYIYKKNGGKHTAINASHSYLNGKYSLILDSDDYLLPNAVEIVLHAWNDFQGRNDIGMLIFLRGDASGNPRAYGAKVGVPEDFRKLKKINITSSDCCEVFKTELLKKFPYSEFDGEYFLSESELWNRIAEDNFKSVYINKVIYICEYLPGGLTDAGRKMRIRNPLGGMCTSIYFMNKSYSFFIRFKKTLLYICYAFFAGMSPVEILKKDKRYFMFKLFCMIPGYFIFLYWNLKYNK